MSVNSRTRAGGRSSTMKSSRASNNFAMRLPEAHLSRVVPAFGGGALLTSVIATATAFVVLPDAPTYIIPHFDSSATNLALAVLVGPIAGLVSVAFVRAIAWADRNRPKRRWRLVAPVLALGLLGLVSIPFRQLLGNGKDIAQLAFSDQLPFMLLMVLLIFKPAAPCCAWAAASPEVCLRRRWRLERCLARLLATRVRSSGLMFSPLWLRLSAPEPCWQLPHKDLSRRSC